MEYVFLLCIDDNCRFRFPALLTEAKANGCPKCHGTVVVVANAVKGLSSTAHEQACGSSLVALLDNIRSIHNVGSMFRTADGAGMTRLYLGGITATPEHPKLAKAALGAELTVGWSYHPNGVDVAATLIAEGYQLWALERLHAAESPLLESIEARPERLALVVGNEKVGVDPGILAQCDAVISLPMIGRKSSLNAAVAFGIAVYYLQFGARNPPNTLFRHHP